MGKIDIKWIASQFKIWDRTRLCQDLKTFRDYYPHQRVSIALLVERQSRVICALSGIVRADLCADPEVSVLNVESDESDLDSEIPF